MYTNKKVSYINSFLTTNTQVTRSNPDISTCHLIKQQPIKDAANSSQFTLLRNRSMITGSNIKTVVLIIDIFYESGSKKHEMLSIC